MHNNSDKCMHSKFTKEYGVIVCLRVDDMLIFGTNMKGVCETKKYLSSMFQMKDLNKVDTILGIKIKRHSEGFALCQSHYVEKVLQRFEHLNIKEANTPFNQIIKLGENTGRTITQLEYASAIGSMMYNMHCTRLDISFSLDKLKLSTSGFVPNLDSTRLHRVGESLTRNDPARVSGLPVQVVSVSSLYRSVLGSPKWSEI